MKSGVSLLVVGGVLLAAGLIMAGFSTFTITKQVLEASTIINETSIQPSLTYMAVMKNLPAGQQLFFTLSSDPSDEPLQARITESDGSTLAIHNITKTPFSSSTATKIPGDLTIEIKNIGSRSVSVKGAIINSPVGQEAGGVAIKDNPSVQNLVKYGIAILAGVVLIIAGIVILIIGAIKYVRGRNNPSDPKSTTK